MENQISPAAFIQNCLSLISESVEDFYTNPEQLEAIRDSIHDGALEWLESSKNLEPDPDNEELEFQSCGTCNDPCHQTQPLH